MNLAIELEKIDIQRDQWNKEYELKMKQYELEMGDIKDTGLKTILIGAMISGGIIAGGSIVAVIIGLMFGK